MYSAWARLVIHDEFSPPQRHHAVGAAYLRAQGRGRIRAVLGLDRAQGELGALVVEAKLPEEGQAPSSSYEGDGYVILRHRETDVVAEALKKLVSTVRVEAR